MNFFVRPYLFTDRDEREEYLKDSVKKYFYSSEFKGLNMSFTEYFNLPLPILNIVDETLEEINKIKIKNIPKLGRTRGRNGFTQ